MSEFLAGQNVNFVLERIFSNLAQYGVDMNIKEEQPQIIQFMNSVGQKYPTETNLAKLNNYTVQTLTKYYMQNRPGRENLENRMERELMERRYDTRSQMQPQGPGLDSIGVDGRMGAGGMGGMGGGGGPGQLSLEQARRMGPPPPIQTSIRRGDDHHYINNNEMEGRNMEGDVREAAERERARRQAEDLEALREGGRPEGEFREHERPERSIARSTNYGLRERSRSNGPSVWLSLHKEHLVDLSGNTFTFGWHSKTLQDLRGPIHLRVEYLTLPKYYPYLFLKFGKERQVFTGQGKSYTAKLIPIHSSAENTTYQIVGGDFPLEELPSNLSIQLNTPEGVPLDLNLITVQKVTKQSGQIGIVTKYPHHLQPNDYLILEFPEQHSCHKVTNLQIIDQYQIQVDSPFAGYFSSNFRIIRNNWNFDVTMRIDGF